jgi:Na+-driven multidrug efflux pump
MVLTNAVRGVRPVGRVLWPKAALAPNAGQALVLAPAQTLAVGWQALSQAYLNAATDNAAIMPAALMQTAWVSSLSQEGFLAMPMQNQ